MGYFLIILLVLGVIQYCLNSSNKTDSTSKPIEIIDELTQIFQSSPDPIEATGELANAFNLMSKYTDVQRENLERQIKGKIVVWKLPVYEVTRKEGRYKIQTSSQEKIFISHQSYVNTFITIKPRNNEEIKYIESLKTGDFITVKGKITGTFMRSIVIEPAIIPLFWSQVPSPPPREAVVNKASECFKYEPSTVILSGILERRTYPGPPNYEDIKKGDIPETGFYLLLNNPICTVGGVEMNVPQENVSLVQLVLDENNYDKLRPYLGKVIKLKGSLFARMTGHHHAPLLLDKVFLMASSD